MLLQEKDFSASSNYCLPLVAAQLLSHSQSEDLFRITQIHTAALIICTCTLLKYTRTLQQMAAQQQQRIYSLYKENYFAIITRDRTKGDDVDKVVSKPGNVS